MTLLLPQILNYKFVEDVVTLNICVKLFQNMSVNEGARAVINLKKIVSETLTLDLQC